MVAKSPKGWPKTLQKWDVYHRSTGDFLHSTRLRAADGADASQLVLVILGVVGPGSGDHHQLLTHLPVHLAVDGGNQYGWPKYPKIYQRWVNSLDG